MLSGPDALVLTAILGGIITAIIKVVPKKSNPGPSPSPSSNPGKPFCPDHSMLVEKTETQDRQIDKLFEISRSTNDVVIRIDQKIEDFLNGKKKR